MADDEPSLLDDDGPATTPLDLLINAISGSQQMEYHGDEAFAPEDAARPSDNGRGHLSLDGFLEGGGGRRHLHSEPGADGDRFSERIRAHLVAPVSAIEVWHPKTAQKSYGKERRILNPPPVLRARGSLQPEINRLTMSSVTVAPPDVLRMSSQTLHISSGQLGSTSSTTLDLTVPGLLPGAPHTGKRKCKAAVSADPPTSNGVSPAAERGRLRDGLLFPGLWVGEEVGKGKAFKLELSIGLHAADSHDVPQDEAVGSIPAGHVPAVQATSGEETSADALLDPPRTVPAKLERRESQPTDSPAPHLTHLDSSPAPWATLSSTSISIVSKPSQKTAKARSTASCLSDSDTFSLWARINAQAVRTKYMKLETGEHPRLTARTGQWTPFRFEIVERAEPPTEPKGAKARFRPRQEGAEGVVTYGSIVRLVDVQSGVRSEMVRLVRVEKNECVLGEDVGHPISELQRIGFVRLKNENENDGSRSYLSAPGARVGGANNLGHRAPKQVKLANLSQAIPPPQTLDNIHLDVVQADDILQPDEVPLRPKKKPKTKRNALVAAAAAEEGEGSQQALLTWARAERRQEERMNVDGKLSGPRLVQVETVEDWMCWVIGGVSSFTYSFFDGNGVPGTIPSRSIEPVPRLLSDHRYHAQQYSLDLVLDNYFDPEGPDSQLRPLQIYLGPLGPLSVSTWRSTASRDSVDGVDEPRPCEPFETGSTGRVRQALSAFPGGVPHVLVKVELPSVEAIAREIDWLSLQSEGITSNDLADAVARRQAVLAVDSEPPWLADDSALRNAAIADECLDPALNPTSDHLQDHGLDHEREHGDLVDALRAVQEQSYAEGTVSLDGISLETALQGLDPALALSGLGEGEIPLLPEMADLKEAIDGHSSVKEAMEERPAEPYLEDLRPVQLELQERITSSSGVHGAGRGGLPVLLVRQRDGLCFGIGRGVVLDQITGSGAVEVRVVRS